MTNNNNQDVHHVATSPRQVLWVMALVGLLAVLLFLGVGVLLFPALRDHPLTVITMGFVIVLGVVTFAGFRATVNLWRHTWPGQDKPQRPSQARRVIQINGIPTDLGAEWGEEEVVDGLGWPVDKVQSALAWTRRHGLTDGAWRAGPLKDNELRTWREWLASKGVARKSGSARTSPWEVSDLDEIADLIDRL